MRKSADHRLRPFDKETVNPSWEAAKRLNGFETDEAIITAEQIPTVLEPLWTLCAKPFRSISRIS